MTKILLAGATGLVGGEVLKLALADDRVVQIVAPTRRPLPAHPKLLNPIIDARDLPTDADWWAVDGGICAIGTTRAKTPSLADYRAIDFDYPLALATRIRAHGANCFALTSSMGANPRSRFFYTQLKGELEKAVGNVGFSSLTIVRPGFIGGGREEHRSMERAMGVMLRLAGPLLRPKARISPAPVIAAILLGAVIDRIAGTRIVSAAEIARRPSPVA